VREVSTDDEPARFRQLEIRDEVRPDKLETLHEQFARLLMAVRKIRQHLRQQRFNVGFAQRQQTGDDLDDALFSTRQKGPDENPGVIGIDEGIGTVDDEIRHYDLADSCSERKGGLKIREFIVS
jgi:hypothetical protein